MCATRMGSVSVSREFMKDKAKKFELAAKSQHFLPLCRCFSSFYSLHNAAGVHVVHGCATRSMQSGQHAFVLVQQMCV